ncbi:MAG: CRTAC1 family protein [Gammaproteobacteria bacterium]|nr:CRTAC1 family protein [Gammaproteobacteria bacterium]
MKSFSIGVLLAALAFSSATAETLIRFDDIADAAGLGDSGLNGAGVAFGDYDNDGDVDIYVSNADAATLEFGIHNRLWQNDGNGKFTDVAKERGVANLGGLGRGLSWGDYDNDGDNDLLVANMQSSAQADDSVPTTLYRNQLTETGSPDFIDQTRAAGLMRQGHDRDAQMGGITDTAGGIAWVDYDADGHLDVLWRSTDYDVDQALFHNNRDGTFTDVTAAAGVGIIGRVLAANGQGSSGWFDMDLDGHVDLLTPNEGDANVLFHNRGAGTFVDITRSRKPPSGLAFLNPGNSNGACVGDIDNDGDMDVYLQNADQANRLIRNDWVETGAITFTDITMASGAGDMRGARGCTMADFDNDGFIDIYVSNGGPSNSLFNDVVGGVPLSVQFYIAWTPGRNTLLRNNGDSTFTDITEGSGAEGVGIGTGVASGDVNNDGFPDILATSRTYYNSGKLVSAAQQNRLFVNRGNKNRWLRIKLVGTSGHSNAYNARVRVVACNLEQHRELFSATGYNSADDPTLLFGLGRHNEADLVEVTWPGGKVQASRNIKAGKTLTIIEAE